MAGRRRASARTYRIVRQDRRAGCHLCGLTTRFGPRQGAESTRAMRATARQGSALLYIGRLWVHVLRRVQNAFALSVTDQLEEVQLCC